MGRAGEYASFHCANGVNAKHKCKFKSYKSVNLVEKPILNYLRDHVFNEEYLQSVIREANRALARMMKEPKEDVQPIVRAISSEKRKLDRLRKIVVDVGEEKVPSIVSDICACEERLSELQESKADAEARNSRPPRRLSKSDIPAMLKDLRGLLNEKVEIAAPLLAELTGPIVVKESKDKVRQGKAWTAHFTLDAVPVIAKLSATRDCPTSGILEYLTTCKWTTPTKVKLDLKKVSRYEVLGPKFLALLREGESISAIAAAHHVSEQTVCEYVHFAETGERPWSKPRKKPGKQRKKAKNSKALYEEIAPHVARLIDQQKLTAEDAQEAIEAELGFFISIDTIRDGYYHARDNLSQAEETMDVQAIRKRHLRSIGKQAEIQKLLEKGELSVQQIADNVGCSTSTVYRIRQRLRASGSTNGRG